MMDEQEEQNLKPVTENVEQAILEALERGASDLVSPLELEFSPAIWTVLLGLSLFTLYAIWKSQGSFLTKLVAFIVCHYLVTGEYDYAYTIPAPGFDFQPVRLMFFSFAFILFYDNFLTRKKSLDNGPPVFAWFEIFLFILVGYNIISQFFHIGELEFKDIIVTCMNQMYVLIIYLTMKKYASRELIRLVCLFMIVGAVIASLIGIAQMVMDPLFMRIGDYRIAYGTFLRANGSFTNEYFYAYFVITALTWTIIFVKKPLIKFPLMGLFILGTFISFQRMSWVVLTLVMALYVFKILKIRYEIMAFISIGAAIILISVVLIFSRDIMGSTLVKQRLSEKPEGRLGYWGMVINNIGKSPFTGYGSTKSKTYFEQMLKVTKSRVRATAAEGDLHSGYLSSMFYFGIPSFVFFVLFNISTILYFIKLIPRHQFFAIPFLLAVLYLVANGTNTLLFDKYISIPLAIHLGLGMGVRLRPEILNDSNQEANLSSNNPNIINKDESIKEQYEYN